MINAVRFLRKHRSTLGQSICSILATSAQLPNLTRDAVTVTFSLLLERLKKLAFAADGLPTTRDSQRPSRCD
jgi:hypothetical protein